MAAAAAAIPTSASPLLRRATAASPARFSLSARFLGRRSSGGATPISLRQPRSSPAIRCSSSALTPELKAALDKVVTSNKVVLFMKGNRDFPQCGFSNTVVQILKQLNVPFETLDVLENELFRQALKQYSSWPTFPQLYIDGEFFGGCDITLEAYKTGELQELLERTLCS